MNPRATQVLRIVAICGIVVVVHWLANRVEAELLPPSSPATDSAHSILRTSPSCDHVIGFSGPTDVAIELDERGVIVGIEIARSRDTRDHVRTVREDVRFMSAFDGMSVAEVGALNSVDGVSGATLTSAAIVEAVVLRLTGNRPSMRFPQAPSLDEVREILPDAESIESDERFASLIRVRGASGELLGQVLRTAPAADDVVGYQGPTDALVGFDQSSSFAWMRVRSSFDNEPYVGYVRQDDYFARGFDGLTLTEFATLDLEAAEIEGVSGATMTSLGVAEGIVVAAAACERSTRAEPWRLTVRDLGTVGVVLLGLMVGLSRLNRVRGLRVVFSLVLIGYLGLINGDLLSQALWLGWAQHGVPYESAVGLVVLSVVAVAVPIASHRNLYCQSLCPHGAVQRLMIGRLGIRWRPSPRVHRALSVLPMLLLVAGVLAVSMGLPIDLVDVEPFDAYVFQIAGWSSITIALVGIVASMFVPMAYCKYGCPTGALLDQLRCRGRGSRASGG